MKHYWDAENANLLLQQIWERCMSCEDICAVFDLLVTADLYGVDRIGHDHQAQGRDICNAV